MATAYTPVLPVPLSGPAIFVSHGGAAFPDLDVVLQGDGVTVILTGNTFINEKTGVTSSTFGSVPDLPVSRFDLVLPEGPNSALAAHGDLCAENLAMPTTIAGHNGAVVKQRTAIHVGGCRPMLRIVRHRAKGAGATIVVRVPSAGTLTGVGRGLRPKTARVRRAGVARLSLRLSRRARSFLAHHPGRKLRVRAGLRFTSDHGAPLSASVTLIIG